MSKFLDSFLNKDRVTKLGGYSVVVTVLVLAILIVLNIFFSYIPSKYTELDMSATKLYSITANTKAVLSNLTEDVTIYHIAQATTEDDIVEKLLSKYDSESAYVSVVKKNPDEYPTFATQYTDGTVSNNDIVVVCGEKYRYITADELYETTQSNYTTYYTAFDGEGQITSAIAYVTNDEFPTIYRLTGHGEASISGSFSDAIEKENIVVNDISLLTTSEIPEDCDSLLIYAPTTDISETEKDILLSYVHDGGNLMIVSGPSDESDLANLRALMAEYGVEISDGIVIENDNSYYAFSYYYMLLPEIEESDITTSQVEDGDYVIAPISYGATITNEDDSYEVTSLLSTSDSSYSKAGKYDITTYDYEEGDTYGPFSVSVSIVDNSSSNEGKIFWVGSSYLLEDTYNSYSSDANNELFFNAFYWENDEVEKIAIGTKSLSYSYLTISDSQVNKLKIIFIFVIPLAFLVMAIFSFVERRKL